MNLRFTPLARADLLEIRCYISSELHNETAAERITRSVLSSCEKLKSFPQMGLALSEKINVQTAIRYMVSEKYLIFYTIDENFISVVRILDSRTNYLQTLFGYDRVQ